MALSGRYPSLGRHSILIVCPAPPGSKSGNRVRALRYQSIFRQLGAKVRIESKVSGRYDTAIVIHAVKSVAAVMASKKLHPQTQVVVVVTGTDLYRFGKTAAFHNSLQLADWVVVSQPDMLGDLPTQYRAKCHVIFQSAKLPTVRRPVTRRRNKVVVCGHLRPEKDPFRTTMAVRRLPETSKIFVDHYGAALQASLEARACAEMQRSGRYRWHGELPPGEVRRKLAMAWLMVLSSKIEGGANVLSEAIAARTPVLATRIPGTSGLLGADYPGYFEVGDTRHLRQLMLRCETEPEFYESLAGAVAKRSHLVEPDRERKAWKELLGL